MNLDRQQAWYANWLDAIQHGVVCILRAYSALVFGRSTATGVLVFGASCFDLGAGTAGFGAVLGALCTAEALGYRRDLTHRGHFGFNAVLCGLALGHGHCVTVLILVKAALLGSVAAIVTASLSQFLNQRFRLPVLALPFVLITSLLDLAVGSAQSIHQSSFVGVPDLPVHLPVPVAGALRAFGSVVYSPTTAAGALVFLGALLTSRFLAGFGLLGVGIASLLVDLSRSPVDQMWLLPANYNALLVSSSLGCVFFVPSLASFAWACVSAIFTTWLALTLGPLLARVGLPVLAWPFVIIVFAGLAVLARRSPGRAPYAPSLLDSDGEANLSYHRMLRLRFGAPGPTKVTLPVEGTWTVTQGFNGDFTHQLPWQHALDFEIMDENGFPFRGTGTNAADYYCFDAPVSAALAGTVVLAYSEHPDNLPATQDLTYPYGNVVVIQHGPAVFSVLAHLKQRSIVVCEGQHVATGTIVARCGSSGRSPRPHLHFQVQSGAHLGAPTLPFEVSHFAVARPGTAEYVAQGVPRIGDCVAAGQAAKAQEIAILRVGAELSLAHGRAEVCHLRSELSPIGERSLYDCVSGERLYFSTFDCVPTFTTLRARARSPLAVLALALPRFPPFSGSVVAHERVPPEWLYSGWMGHCIGLLDLLGIGTQVNAQAHVTRTERSLTASTDLEVRWLGRTWRSFRASVKIEGSTLTSLALSQGTRMLFQATDTVSHANATGRRCRRGSWNFERAIAYVSVPVIAGVATISLFLSPKPCIARAIPSSLAESYRYETLGDYRQAIDQATRATEESPRAYFLRLRLAYLEYQAKLYGKSAEDYAEAAKLAPEAVEPLLGELKALALLDRYERAIEVAGAILQFDSKNYSAHSRRAWALYQSGRYAEAVVEYSALIELYPGDIEMRLGRAYAMSGAKRPVEAALEFREVLTRMPENSRAKAALGLP